MKSNATPANTTNTSINPKPEAAQLNRAPAPDPRKKATITYCGIANSHHFTSASPRDSLSGYATSSLAG